MTILAQWATTGPKIRDDQATVDELESQGWTRWGADPRYPHSVLMRRDEVQP